MSDALWHDVRDASRSIRRSPAFSAVIVATLALAIGGTTAIFGVVDAVLLRSLPYREPARLVMLYQGMPKASNTSRRSTIRSWRTTANGPCSSR